MPNTAPETSLSITLPPLTADSTPNALPWAVDGTLLAPTDPQQDAGYAPYPAAPPIYSLENFARYFTSQWLERLSACGFFAQRATSRITIGGTVTAGNTYTVDDGTNTDTYTATSADAAAGTPLLSVVTNWAQQLRSGDLRNTLSGSVGGTGLLDVIYRDPGTDWPAGTPTVSEVGSGTIAIADLYGGSAGQLSVMTSPAGTDAAACDFLHGAVPNSSLSPEGAATKVQFRKGAKNGAFRAGKWTGTQANLANVGEGSVAFGLDTIASGLDSFAAGDFTVASGQDSTALGNGSTASGDQSLAAGETCTASGQAAVALGTGSVASQDYSTALGHQSSPLNEGEVSIAAGQFAAAGDSQIGFVVAKCLALGVAGTIAVPDGQAFTLALPGGAGGHVYSLRIQIVAKWDSGGAGTAADQAYWDLSGVAFVDAAGAVTLNGLGGVTASTASQANGASYAVNVSGATADRLNIACTTNNAGVNSRFVATITYGRV